MPIKNIIFDLGGVIINLDYHLTPTAFSQLSDFDCDTLYSHMQENPLFSDFETGKISATTFRDLLRKKLNLSITDDQFDRAWNAMLLDIPKQRLDFIKSLKEKYKVFLFSNTNDIHLKEVFNICYRQHGFDSFKDFFHKEYYSHLIGKRKPHVEGFISILMENHLIPEETLFIDDTLQHINGAKLAGLHVFHLIKEKTLFDIIDFIDEIDKTSPPKNETIIIKPYK